MKKWFWFVLLGVLVTAYFIYDLSSVDNITVLRGYAVEDVQDFVKENINNEWFENLDNVEEIIVNEAKILKAKEVDKSLHIYETKVLITGHYIPEAGAESGMKKQFKITKYLKLQKRLNNERYDVSLSEKN